MPLTPIEKNKIHKMKKRKKKGIFFYRLYIGRHTFSIIMNSIEEEEEDDGDRAIIIGEDNNKKKKNLH